MTQWQYVSLIRLENSAIIGGLGSGTYFFYGNQKKKVCGVDEVEIIQVMNSLGKDRWELVGTVHHTTQAHASYTSYIFKREAIEVVAST